MAFLLLLSPSHVPRFFFRGKIRALHVIRDLASRPKVLNFPLIQAEKCPSNLVIKRVREHAESFQTFLGMQLCLESAWKLLKGKGKYLQPLLMTIRVICSLFPEKGHNFHHRLEKGHHGVAHFWWCSLVSGYTKSGSKGPILCPRKDNENPTTTDETFNAFFLLF